MKLGYNLMCLHNRKSPVFLAAGFFDGVHRGHQAIIRNIVGAARRERAAAWVMTFDTHPLKILKPETAPRLLTSTPHKLHLLRSLGVQGCIVIRFTRALARREPEEFVARLARSMPALRQIVIGRNWTFGRNGRGTPALLKAMAPAYGFKVTVIPPVRWRGKVVSSTRIRAAVMAGRLKDAAGMLGRPFSLLGTVVPGRGLGRKLGIPTANLDPHNEVVPPDGVYVVRAYFNGAGYPGIANLGVQPTIPHLRPWGYGGQAHLRPWGFHRRQGYGGQAGGQAHLRSSSDIGRSTFASLLPLHPPALALRPSDAHRSGLREGGSVRAKEGPASVLELHLFGLRRNLYGKAIEVTFLKKLRRERIFPSLPALQRQIRKDIAWAQAWFGRKQY